MCAHGWNLEINFEMYVKVCQKWSELGQILEMQYDCDVPCYLVYVVTNSFNTIQ